MMNRFGKWIPVSKAFPKEPKGVHDIKPYLVTCRDFVYPISLSYMGDSTFEDINGQSDVYDVIAWMEMPKVYKIPKGDL